MLREEAPQATPHDCGPSAAAKGKDTLTHACRTTSILQMHADTYPESHYNGLQPQNMPMGALCAQSQPATNVGSWAVCTPHPAITGERRITTKTEGGEHSFSTRPNGALLHAREKDACKKRKGHRATQHSFPVRGVMSRLLPEPRNNSLCL